MNNKVNSPTAYYQHTEAPQENRKHLLFNFLPSFTPQAVMFCIYGISAAKDWMFAEFVKSSVSGICKVG